jgi:hypothetical protein
MAITEHDWLAGTDPVPLLRWLGERASPRKLRLFACAWGYGHWRRLADERSRAALVVAERYADGAATEAELHAAWVAAQAAWAVLPLTGGRRNARNRPKVRAQCQAAKAAAWAATLAADPGWDLDQACRCAGQAPPRRRFDLADHVREVFGNPFRTAALDPAWRAWNGGTVLRVAEALYEEGRAEAWPVLADALAEAGCQDEDLLDHCRRPGGHVRGCWAVDLVLGKA